MTIYQIKQDADLRWFNDQLTMNLSASKEHVDNANGILYFGVFMRLLILLGSIERRYKDQADEACDILRVDDGNFVRFPHDKSVTNSHDNYDAISGLQTMGIESKPADEICNRGDKIGWDFNLTFDEALNFKTLRQPGTIAFTQICAERRPYLLNLICLVVGLIIGSFQFSKHTHHICWYRSHCLRVVIAKYANLKSWLHITIPLSFTFMIFDLASMWKFKNRHQAVVNYYRDDHPNCRLALELIRKEASE